MKQLSHLMLILSIVLPVWNLSGQNTSHQLDSLFTALHQQGKFSGNVLIAEKGKPVYQKSFGLANEQTGEKLSEQSIFELASVSKQFTAMAIMILKEKGKLTLDSPIGTYLPELAGYGHITVRNLLNHTGGLPDYMALMDSLYDKSKIATNKDLIEVFAKYKPEVLFEPNTQYEYSNTGYALLASIIEKASGQSYGTFLEQAIFKPLKMNNTFVYNRRLKPRNVEHYAYGYVYSDSLQRFMLPDSIPETSVVVWLDGIVGDGTVNSTTGDLLKWDRALYTSKLLSKADMQEIFNPGVLSDKKPTDYGFGWGIVHNPTFGTIFNHSGGWPGYATFIERHVDHDKTIILLTNHEGSSLPVKTIRRILYNQTAPPAVVRQAIELPVTTLAEYAGEYELQPGVMINVFLVDNNLKVQLTGQEAFPIYAETNTKFFLKVVDAQIAFFRDGDNKVNKLILYQNGQEAEALKVK